MIEFSSNIVTTIESDGSLAPAIRHTLNPGLRFCIDNGFTQIVPGIGFPTVFENHNHSRMGLFLYLSIEPDYLPFYKPKSSGK